jgi:integrase
LPSWCAPSIPIKVSSPRNALCVFDVGLRPSGRIAQAEWAEINLETTEWRIRAERMKMGQQQIVPLWRQP